MNLDCSLDFAYKDRIYLNNASTARMPRQSIQAMSDFLVEYNKLGPDSESADVLVREKLNGLRKEVAELINCRQEEVVITQSVTDGINFVANGLKLSQDSSIIIRGSSHEHPANHFPWVRAAKRTHLENLPIDEFGYFGLDTLRNTINEKTGLVVLSHALFNTGAIIPVEEIGDILSEKNIPYFVDAAQTVGCLEEVDVSKIKCDFMSFNGSKWLCGPMGMGIFFCKKDSADKIEPLQVGGESAIFHQDDIVYKELPARFQAGFRNWSGVAGLEYSIKYLKKIGIKNIRKKNVELANLMQNLLSRIDGVKLYGPVQEEKRTSIVSFSIKGQESKDIVARLEKKGIVLAVRDIFSTKIVRASPHFFNTESDIESAVNTIKN